MSPSSSANESSSQGGVHSPTSWPSAAQGIGGGGRRCGGLGVDRHPERGAQAETHPEPARTGARRVRERGRGSRGVVAVARLVPGDRIEGDGGVEHGAGEDAVHGHAAARGRRSPGRSRPGPGWASGRRGRSTTPGCGSTRRGRWRRRVRPSARRLRTRSRPTSHPPRAPGSTGSASRRTWRSR